MIPISRLSGGGVVAEFFRVPQKPTRLSGGGGVVAGIFRCEITFLPPDRVVFVGTDTYFWLDTPEIWDFLLTKKNRSNSVRFFDISVRPGDQE